MVTNFWLNLWISKVSFVSVVKHPRPLCFVCTWLEVLTYLLLQLIQCIQNIQRNPLCQVTLFGHFSFTTDITQLTWRKSCLYKPHLSNKFCPIEFYATILLSFHISHPGSHSHSIPLSRFPSLNFFSFLFCVSKTYPRRFLNNGAAFQKSYTISQL